MITKLWEWKVYNLMNESAMMTKCLYIHGLGAEHSTEIENALSSFKLFYPDLDYKSLHISNPYSI